MYYNFTRVRNTLTSFFFALTFGGLEARFDHQSVDDQVAKKTLGLQADPVRVADRPDEHATGKFFCSYAQGWAAESSGPSSILMCQNRTEAKERGHATFNQGLFSCVQKRCAAPES